jgi:hypothetical protein
MNSPHVILSVREGSCRVNKARSFAGRRGDLLSMTPLCVLVSMTVQAEEAAPIPTDWKTYSNTTYGFQFKYPPQFQVKEHFKNPHKSVFSTRINSSPFAVGLLLKGAYTGMAVTVVKKENLFFRTKMLAGFYKFEPSLNTWLGYNPVSTEYGSPLKTYFYLGSALCSQTDPLGPDHLPSYGTTALVPKTEPRNDVVLTDQAYAFEIPREDPDPESRIEEDLTDTREQIRNSFTVIPPAKGIRADCEAGALTPSGTIPVLIDPKPGQTIDCRKPVPVTFSGPIPEGAGAVFFLDTSDNSDPDKIVFSASVGDVAPGPQGTLTCDNAAVQPGPKGTASMALHLLFYKKVHGRKILLGTEANQKIPVEVK